MTVEERVARGAQMLDEVSPGWYRLINLDTLDLSACEACVCGQLGRRLGWDMFPYMDAYPAEYGFDVGDDYDEYEEPGEEYLALDLEWQKAIKARLAFDKLPPVMQVTREEAPA